MAKKTVVTFSQGDARGLQRRLDEAHEAIADLEFQHATDASGLPSEVAEPLVFEVTSAEDAKAPMKLLRAASADEPAIVLIARGRGGSHAGWENLIEAMMPAVDVPTPVEVLQARRNAEARSRLLAEFGALTAAEVAGAAGSRAKNVSAMASRWLNEGEVLAVTHHGTRYFPAFQFDETGRPRPVIREVLRHLGYLGEWQRAIWFVTRTLLLGDARPVDVLRDRPLDVVAAAETSAAALD